MLLLDIFTMRLMAEFVCPFRFPAFGFRLAPNSEMRGGILSASKKSFFNKSYKNPELPDFTYDMIRTHINSQIDQKIKVLPFVLPKNKN